MHIVFLLFTSDHQPTISVLPQPWPRPWLLLSLALPGGRDHFLFADVVKNSYLPFRHIYFQHTHDLKRPPGEVHSLQWSLRRCRIPPTFYPFSVLSPLISITLLASVVAPSYLRAFAPSLIAKLFLPIQEATFSRRSFWSHNIRKP